MNDDLHAVELRPGRAFLVVADARIDEDRVMPGAHHKAVKAEDQLAGARFEKARAQERGVGAHHLGVEIGEEIGRVEKRTLVIGDAVDLEIADAEGLHLSSLVAVEDGVRPAVDCSAAPPGGKSRNRCSPRRRFDRLAGAGSQPGSTIMRAILVVSLVAFLGPAVALAQTRQPRHRRPPAPRRQRRAPRQHLRAPRRQLRVPNRPGAATSRKSNMSSTRWSAPGAPPKSASTGWIPTTTASSPPRSVGAAPRRAARRTVAVTAAIRERSLTCPMTSFSRARPQRSATRRCGSRVSTTSCCASPISTARSISTAAC